MAVPTLDHQVFTPGAPRDYVGHALQIASMYPDYGKMVRESQQAEMQKQALQLKYQTDLQKAQQFLDLYPDYRDAQIAQLRARTAQANATADTMPMSKAAQAAMWSARANYYNTQNNPKGDPAILAQFGGDLPPPPGSTPAASPAPANIAPNTEPAAPVQGGSVFDIGGGL